MLSRASNCESEIRLLALVEMGANVGLAKGLLDFCRHARSPQAGGRAVAASFVTFQRAAVQPANGFVAAARAAGFDVDVIHERFRYDPRAVAALRRIAERRAPDIIETEHVKSHFLLRLAGLHRRRPWVAFHHGYTATDLKVRAYNELDRWSLRAADRVVTVCRAFAEELARIGVEPEKISVLHNAINPDFGRGVSAAARRALRASLGIAEGERMVLSVGRLSREKAHADLVAAFAQMRRTQPAIKARLVIAGDGPERARIARLAAALGVEREVTLAGQVKDVAAYYAAADLFALPSLSEGSPNALLEAMAVGLPIVATAVGGVPEMVTHNRQALLTGPRDPQVLAEAMACLLVNKSLAWELAANARAAALARHSPEARRQSLSAIYRQLAQAHAAAAPPAPRLRAAGGLSGNSR
jgi:glycosyltransferase involved in cell wall biosynthesis